MGCISSLAKYIIFLFNFLIAVGGIVLIAIGAVYLVNEYKALDGVINYSVGGFAVAIGVFIFIIAFLGCCGAIKENSCMLTTYAIILILLFIVQLVLGILAFVAIQNDDDQLKTTVTKSLQEIFNRLLLGNEDDMEAFYAVQRELKCCGVNGVIDYPLLSLPSSCCADEPTVCTVVTPPFRQGCADALTDFVTDNMKIIGGVAIGFCIIELVGAIFACIVRNNKD